MFREMRRRQQTLTQEECKEILHRGTSGVLAVSGDEGYPYAVPMSYVYADNGLYFHCARYGHKIDAIRRNDKASFCVIDQDEIVPEQYTTYFRSVIVFGKIHEVTTEDDLRKALMLLARKYAPMRTEEQHRQAVHVENVCVLRLDIEHMSGKQAIELAKD